MQAGVSYTQAFPNLRRHQYMNLTTFRKNGDAVATPVWFAQEGDAVYLMTPIHTGKIKRIRYNAQVEVAPCTIRGEVLGEAAEGMARILNPVEAQVARRALEHKYGLMKRLYRLMLMMRGLEVVYIEIMAM